MAKITPLPAETRSTSELEAARRIQIGPTAMPVGGPDTPAEPPLDDTVVRNAALVSSVAGRKVGGAARVNGGGF